MISFEFDYYRPTTLAEAVQIFGRADRAGLNPLYYGGGTEIITMAEANQLRTGAVIDIKSVPECRVLSASAETMIFGSAVTLTEAASGIDFPLLRATLRHLSDRTIRNKTTLGGNICGRIIYREALLPFLLADAQAVVAGADGIRSEPAGRLFGEGRGLSKGELLVQLRLPRRYAGEVFFHRKRTRLSGIDYPLVTIAAIRTDRRVRVAVSGVAGFPFRSGRMEERLNEEGGTPGSRIEAAIREIPGPVLNDTLGSAAYRLHLLRLGLAEMMMKLQGGSPDDGAAHDA
jgi:CO/xanthine dehydrogenase FAD-binding subunit